LRFQFGIRSLLVLTVAVAAQCSWLVCEIRRAKPQRETVEALNAIRRDVPGAGFGFRQGRPPIPPAWLDRLLAYGGPTWESLLWDTCVVDELSLRGSSVTDRELQQCVNQLPGLERLELCQTRITDAGLKNLKVLAGLVQLVIVEPQITDAGLEPLKGLTRLRELHVLDTQATDDGVWKLRRALPRCHIITDVDEDPETYRGPLEFEFSMPILIESLTDARSSTRKAAARSLGAGGARAEAAVPALTRLLKDNDEDVRTAALEALEKISGSAATMERP